MACQQQWLLQLKYMSYITVKIRVYAALLILTGGHDREMKQGNQCNVLLKVDKVCKI